MLNLHNRMVFWLIPWLLVVLLISSPPVLASFVSTIYYSSWSQAQGHLPSDIDLSLVTHINYAFFDINMATMNLTLEDAYDETEKVIPMHTANQTPLKNSSLPWASTLNSQMDRISELNVTSIGLLGQLNQLKSINPNLLISMSIGGSSSAAVFERVANNKRGVDFFVNNTVHQMLHYGFDGVDIDWEFPNQQLYRPYLTYMMSSFRLALGSVSPPCGKYHLSMALPMDIPTLQDYNLPELATIVDYFHLMCYDASGPGSSQADFQSPLYRDPLASTSDNINQTVHYLIDQGVPSSMIVMGVPLYAHSFAVSDIHDSTAKKHSCAKIDGIKQSSEDCVVEYRQIPPPGFTEVYDSDVGATYASRESPPGVLVYDNVDSMNQKAQFIMDNNLAGAFWWDSKGDTWASNWNRSLVKAYVDAINEDLLAPSCRTSNGSFHGELVHHEVTSSSASNTPRTTLLWILLLLWGAPLYF